MKTSLLKVSFICCCGLLGSPARAQIFPLAFPGATPISIGMTGTNTSAVGGVAGGSLSGHSLISQGAPPGAVAYYYLEGAEATGLSTPGLVPYSATAQTTALNNMAATSQVFTDNPGLSKSLLRLRFGPTGAQSTTWNLGADINGTNYSASAGSPIEDRIYAADPGAVEAALYYNTTKLLTFGYSAMYMIINYQPAPDTVQAYSDGVSYAAVGGLTGTNHSLAAAIVSDFNAGGGLAQLRFDSIQNATRLDAGGVLGAYGLFSFTGTVQAVPEPGTLLLSVLGVGGLCLLARFRSERDVRPGCS